MKLAPVLTELVKPIAGVEVVQRGISVENIAIAVALDDQELLGRITVAQASSKQDGTLQRIRRKWLGNPYTDQSLAVHLTSPRVARITPLGWPVSIKAKKGETSDHPGRR